MSLILCIEDDEKIAANLVLRLRERDYGVVRFRTAEEAESWLGDRMNPEPDMLLVDVRLPGMSGIDLLAKLGEDRPPAVIISGEASMAETLEGLRLGVHDFLDKPISQQRLMKSVENCIEHARLRRELDDLRARDQKILGVSAKTRDLLRAIETVAGTEARVLIRGESGSGKELVAASIHRLSRRRKRAFVKLNCAAIPHHLVEDELFGHVKGAFTDAKYAKVGLFEQANGGTLLLDEIGDMDLEVQSRLLRVLEDGRVRRIGDASDREVDVRIVAATHRDLEQMVRDGRFREDLYFRLASVPVEVPALRERPEDIPLLFTEFLGQFCRKHGRTPMLVEPEVHECLSQYLWPGNVRELRNLAERISVFGISPVTVDQLPTAILSKAGKHEEGGLLDLAERFSIVPLARFRAQCEKEYIELVLQRTNWNVSRAAEMLEIQRTHLHHKLSTLGIERPGRATIREDEG